MDKKWLYLVRAVYISIGVYLAVSVIVFHDTEALGLLLLGGLLAWVDIHCFEKAVFSKIMVGSRLEKAFLIVKYLLVFLLLSLLTAMIAAEEVRNETSAGVLAVIAAAIVMLLVYVFVDFRKRRNYRH